MNESKLSCGVVVARQSGDRWLTLLLRAYHHWDFPKGIRERGEDPMQAAIREVREETSIDDLSFEWGDRFFETGPYSRGKIARYFIATTRQEAVVMGPSPETGVPEKFALDEQALEADLSRKLEVTIYGELGRT